jgi:hypothetical protein
MKIDHMFRELVPPPSPDVLTIQHKEDLGPKNRFRRPKVSPDRKSGKPSTQLQR